MMSELASRARHRARRQLPAALPDFLIVGFTKTATTTVFDVLRRHPLVAPPHSKQLHYFDYNFSEGPDWYARQFPSAVKRRLFALRHGRPFLTGEATPSYVDHPSAAERIHEMLPDVRLIVQLRNPIDRAYSHYRMTVREGDEDLPFEAAVDAEEARLAGEVDRVRDDPGYRSLPLGRWSYLRRGCYAEHLEPWLERFPREQLLVLTVDELQADWAGTIGRCWSFLGLPPHDPGPPLRKLDGGAHEPLSAETRARLGEYFAPHNSRLGSLLGFEPDWS
jgi:hypothetical protein